MLLLQLEVSLAVIESAVELATRHAVPVMLNPAPAQELPTALMRRVAYLVPNAGEAALLSGIPVHDPDSARQAAAHLHEFGVERLVITLGDQGAYYSQESDGAHVPAYPVAPVDTTGAGDALLAGLAVGLTSGMGLAEAVRFGSAAGALATTRLGAQPSLPTRKEVEALFNPKD
jgi:ribokinase